MISMCGSGCTVMIAMLPWSISPEHRHIVSGRGKDEKGRGRVERRRVEGGRRVRRREGEGEGGREER